MVLGLFSVFLFGGGGSGVFAPQGRHLINLVETLHFEK
jgi:hypothetical protein